MRQMAGRTNRGPATAQWLIVVVLSVLVGALGAELLLSDSPAGAQTASAGRSGAFAIAGQITGDTYGLYLVDLDSGTICLYEYVAGERRLWLRAARTFLPDVKLDEYNTQPAPKEIQKMAAEARRLKDTPPKQSP